MSKINLNQNQFSDLLNLINNVFFPLKNFVDKKKCLQIIKTEKVNKKFFPYPILFGVKKSIYLKIKNNKAISLYFNKKILAKVTDVNFFRINKNYCGKKIYGKRFRSNPYFIKFCKEK